MLAQCNSYCTVQNMYFLNIYIAIPMQLSKAVVDYALQHHDCTPVIDDAYPPRVYLDVSQLEPTAATVSHRCLDCQLRLDGAAEEVQFHLTSPLVVHSPDAQSGMYLQEHEVAVAHYILVL